MLTQLEGKRFRRRALPPVLGEWQDVDSAPQLGGDVRVEKRYIVLTGGLFSRTRLLEQTRARNAITGQIVGDPSERVIDRWFELFQ